MKPAPFEYARPVTLDEALGLLAASQGDAKPLAGGQSLVPLLNLRLASPARLIDLSAIAELAGIRVDGGRLRIGAMTRQQTLLSDALIARHAPLIARAAAHIGHVQTRSRGTVGGSLAHADPAAELPLVMVTLNAELTLRSVRGERTVPARAFFRDALVTALADDELLVEASVPVAEAGARFAFRELSRRHGDFALVAVAVERRPSGAVSAAVGGLTGRPHFCAGLADAPGAARHDEARLAALIDTELAGLAPLSDVHASGDYRRHVAGVVLADCLAEVTP